MKIGSRILAISETSPVLGRSLLCGVVVTRYILEDVRFTFITIGGLDATEGVLRLWELLGRPDIKLILLSGRIVAGYNIIDVVELYERIQKPIVVLPYLRPKKAISKILRKIFGENDKRLEIYRKVKAYSVKLNVGRERIAIVIGIDPKEAEAFLNSNLIGKTPYALYLADRIARGIRKSLEL